MATSQSFNTVLCVNDYAEKRFDKFCKKMTKISAKLKLESFAVEKLYTISVVIQKSKNQVVEKKTQVYSITGQEPVLEGWHLVAKLTFDQRFGDHALIIEVPEQHIPEEFTKIVNSLRCDHCHVERYRKISYVVANEQGEYKQIGSTCLGDFIRENTKEMLEYYAHFWTFIEENRKEEGEQSFCRVSFWTDDILIAALRHIKKYGFVSVKQEQSTSAMVLNILNSTREHAKSTNTIEEYDWLTANVTQEEKNELEQILTAGRELKNDNSFCHNVKLLCGCKYWLNHEVNTMIAWIGSYLKQQAEKKQIKKEGHDVSKYLGTIGEKIVVQNFLCINMQCYDGFYGNLSWLQYGQDEEGNDITFYSSKKIVDIGETVSLKGTIKELKEFRGIKKTVLTRVKIVN